MMEHVVVRITMVYIVGRVFAGPAQVGRENIHLRGTLNMISTASRDETLR